MAWQEIITGRSRHARQWHDSATGQRHVHASIAPLCYAETVDGLVDTPLDLTAQRITNSQLDGWLVTANHWHFAIGQPGDKPTDGWVGFGGRKGSHWFRFRLVRFGYLHVGTRNWQDVGGAPTYNRANLSRTMQTKTIGPEGVQVQSVVSMAATWADLWVTPGSGSVRCQWRVSGSDLKEEIVINQAAREWVTANRPPTTPAAQTWFGAVFQLDLSDIPRVLRNGVLQTIDTDTDFDDPDGTVPWSLEDASQRLLSFLPVGRVYGPTLTTSPILSRPSVPLRRRLWRDPDGNFYLMVGARVNQLNSLSAGDLTFDPTFTIAETFEDAYSNGTAEIPEPGFGNYIGLFDEGGDSPEHDAGWIWRGTGISSGDTIDTATVVLTDAGDTAGDVEGDWWGYDVDSPADFDAGHSHRVSDHEARTTASVADDFSGGVAGTHTSPSLVTVLQEIVDRAGFSGDIGLTWRNTGLGNYYASADYSISPGDAADLVVTFTPAAAGGPRFNTAWAMANRLIGGGVYV